MRVMPLTSKTHDPHIVYAFSAIPAIYTDCTKLNLSFRDIAVMQPSGNPLPHSGH